MKLQPESKKELLRIACGVSLCTAVMWVVFAALHLVGWVVFDYRVLLGGIIGALVAIGNFAGICFVVQKVIDEPDEKKRKAQLQISYNTRMLLQALWIIIAIAAPCFQAFADYFDTFVNSEDCTCIRNFCKEIGIPEKTAVALLLNHRYLYRSPSGWLMPFADKSARGYFIVRDCYGRSGKLVQQTRVTCKGKNHLFKLFKKWGVIE